MISIPLEELKQGRQVPLQIALENAEVINSYLKNNKGKDAKIIVPKGVFTIGNQLQVYSRTVFSGSGEETIFNIHPEFPGGQGYIVNASFSLGNLDQDDKIVIENFSLDGTLKMSKTDNSRGIFLNKASNTTIRNLQITGIAEEAIYIRSHFSNIVIRNHVIENCKIFKRGLASKCIILASATDDGTNSTNKPAVVENFKILNNELIGGDHGVCLFNVKDGLVEGNICKAQLARGIIMSPNVSDVIVKDNKVDSAGSTGIHMAYFAKNITITGNTVSNSLKDMSGVGIEGQGIKAYAGFKNIKIINNTSSGNATDGIALEGGGNGEEFIIKGNLITGNHRNGIRLWAGEITMKIGGDIQYGSIENNIVESNDNEPVFIGSDNKGKNRVKNIKITKSNSFKARAGQQNIIQEYSHNSNSILKN